MKFSACVTSPFVRHFPAAPIAGAPLRSVDIALNERFSFQVAVRCDAPARLSVSVSAPEGWRARVRRVGLVPLPHHNTDVPSNPADLDGIGQIPGLVPDPLFDETSACVAAGETVAFWVGVVPPPGAAPGEYPIAAEVAPSEIADPAKRIGRTARRTLLARLHNVALPPRSGFDVTHWFYADCIIDRYGTDMFYGRFWEILERYFRDIADHGQNVIYVPLFTPPLDGVKRPSQLLKVSRRADGGFAFDWSDVRRYVRLARKCGLEKFEWCHFFGQWGCRVALRVYEGQGGGGRLLWPADTAATSPEYRDFLARLLPEFRAFLARERILSSSIFHLSDEPHGDEAKANYLAAKAMMNGLAPWMRFSDAVSDIAFGSEGVIDIPVPSVRTALDFLGAGIESWCYYCCYPRGGYIQHLMDTPLAKIAMHGLLFYRWPFRGYLHWGLNYWNLSQTSTPIDPYAVSDAKAWERGWAYGDTFLVYPGEDGPVDSIRWEVFAESLQDYALLQALGISRDDPMLAPIRSFSDFPKAEVWRRRLRRRLFSMAGK